MFFGVSFARMTFTVFPICAAKVYVIIYMTKSDKRLIISVKCGIETRIYVARKVARKIRFRTQDNWRFIRTVVRKPNSPKCWFLSQKQKVYLAVYVVHSC